MASQITRVTYHDRKKLELRKLSWVRQTMECTTPLSFLVVKPKGKGVSYGAKAQKMTDQKRLHTHYTEDRCLLKKKETVKCRAKTHAMG